MTSTPLLCYWDFCVGLWLDMVMTGCDVNKTCFGLPDSCDDPADCDLMATWRLINNEVTKLELYSSLGGRGSYVALGLSRDRRMGEDLVVACLSHKERVSAELSWNNGRLVKILTVADNEELP